MRVVVQRVSRASVSVDGLVVGEIGLGLVALFGVAAGDTASDIDYVVSKLRDLRVFADNEGRMNRSVQDVGGAILAISQFTLLADARKGRRPSFDGAEAPERAREIYERLVVELKQSGVHVATGVFQADMQVELVNDGPVTILLDSRRMF
jgi:D-tyrosyl-tRNA(Tyr) deacylase